MTEKMQMLPLLQGLTMQEFSDLIINIKLDFRQFHEGETIVEQSEKCNDLIYILDGTFETEYHDDRHPLILSETCQGNVPHLIEPYNMFGLKRTYERTYTCKSEVSAFYITREFFTTRMLMHPIVRTNYINYLCNTLRKSKGLQRYENPTGTECKMIAAISSYSLFDHGEKTIRITMNDFADMIDETRLNVSIVLNRWKAQQLTTMRRYSFTIKDWNTLLQSVQKA